LPKIRGARRARLAKAFKHAAVSAYGVAGSEFVRRIVKEGADAIAAMIRNAVGDFIASNVKVGG